MSALAARLGRAPVYARIAAGAVRRLPAAARLLAGSPRPAALVWFGAAPGDDLLLTPVLRALHESGRAPLWVMSRHPGLFAGNPHVARVVPYDDALAAALGLLGVPRLRLRYHEYDAAADRSLAPPEHVIALLARRAGVEGRVRLAPELYLTPEESARGRLAPRQVAIQSTGRGAAMHIANKEWFPERFQEVVRLLGGELTFVQLGSAADPPLEGALDLRGKTSLREAAAILQQSVAFVGLVGFLMHLARAVGTPGVIVYGGREHPSQSGYPENHNLYTPMPCGPCWLWNRCDFGRACMDAVAAGDVAVALVDVVAGRAAAAGGAA